MVAHGGHFGIEHVANICIRGSIDPENMVLQLKIKSLTVKIAEM